MGTEGIFYEAAVETSFGEVSSASGEASVGAFLVFMFNVFSTIFLLLTSCNVDPSILTWLTSGACGVSIAVLLLYDGTMKRALEDQKGMGYT